MSDLTAKPRGYESALGGIIELLDSARRASAKAVNAVMTATYWELGRRIVELEQQGHERAEYGQGLMRRLSADLSKRFGRGFSFRNLNLMRRFYLEWRHASRESGRGYEIVQTLTAQSPVALPLPWSHYVQLMRVKDPQARQFYEQQALTGGWTTRQLRRQIATQFYERASASQQDSVLVAQAQIARPEDLAPADAEVKDPFLLEFLNLDDEYSELDLEAALIRSLQQFLLELGNEFCFVGRQKRLRIGGKWFRVDLVFFHRRLRCLVVIDLKIDDFSYADAGQMNMYLNYARRHWALPDENPPVGLILCAAKDHAEAQYALEGLQNQVLASEYRTTLPDEVTLQRAILERRRLIEAHRSGYE